MTTKLTLSLDKTIIDRAKELASEQGTSLSKLIESYLRTVTSDNDNDLKISPLVKQLSGVIDTSDEDGDKKEYISHLEEKYS